MGFEMPDTLVARYYFKLRRRVRRVNFEWISVLSPPVLNHEHEDGGNACHQEQGNHA
jgi:hypothetical protein